MGTAISYIRYPIEKTPMRRRDIVIMLAVIPIAAAVSSAAALYIVLNLAYIALEPHIYSSIEWLVGQAWQAIQQIPSHVSRLPKPPKPLNDWAFQLGTWLLRMAELLSPASKIPAILEANKHLAWLALGVLARAAMILPAYRLGWVVLRRAARHMLYRAARKLAEEMKRAGARWEGYVEENIIPLIGYRDAGDHIELYTA